MNNSELSSGGISEVIELNKFHRVIEVQLYNEMMWQQVVGQAQLRTAFHATKRFEGLKLNRLGFFSRFMGVYECMLMLEQQLSFTDETEEYTTFHYRAQNP